jgi:hypothetical protein
MATLTHEEILATLRNSSLPTVLVEGKGDMSLYRKLEKRVGFGEMSFLECEGRNTLLEVYKDRGSVAGKKVAFLADLDLWHYVGVPTVFEEIVFTTGYSIENDLYFDGHERLNDLLDTSELEFVSSLLFNVSEWFGFEVERMLQGNEAEFANTTLLSTSVTALKSNELLPEFLQSRNFIAPSQSLLAQIQDQHFSGLRGKFIFQAFLKVFAHLRTKNETTYSEKHLWDICYREAIKHPNSRLQQMLTAILSKLN